MALAFPSAPNSFVRNNISEFVFLHVFTFDEKIFIEKIRGAQKIVVYKQKRWGVLECRPSTAMRFI